MSNVVINDLHTVLIADTDLGMSIVALNEMRRQEMETRRLVGGNMVTWRFALNLPGTPEVRITLISLKKMF